MATSWLFSNIKFPISLIIWLQNFLLLLLTIFFFKILMDKNCTNLHCFQVILKHFLSLPDQREHFLIHHLLGSGWCTHPIINQGFLGRERNTIKQMKRITSIFINQQYNENRTKVDNIAMNRKIARKHLKGINPQLTLMNSIFSKQSWQTFSYSACSLLKWSWFTESKIKLKNIGISIKTTVNHKSKEYLHCIYTGIIKYLVNSLIAEYWQDLPISFVRFWSVLSHWYTAVLVDAGGLRSLQ